MWHQPFFPAISRPLPCPRISWEKIDLIFCILGGVLEDSVLNKHKSIFIELQLVTLWGVSFVPYRVCNNKLALLKDSVTAMMMDWHYICWCAISVHKCSPCTTLVNTNRTNSLLVILKTRHIVSFFFSRSYHSSCYYQFFYYKLMQNRIFFKEVLKFTLKLK